MVMGKGEERNGTTAQAGESTFLAKSSSEASKMLEAALLQMDDIISGTIDIFMDVLFVDIHVDIYSLSTQRYRRDSKQERRDNRQFRFIFCR